MYANMECGKCGSSMHIDSEWEESTWMMAHRFADSHIKCGTFTATTEMTVRPEYLASPYEEEEEDEGSVDDTVE
jgi:hypothetical protein